MGFCRTGIHVKKKELIFLDLVQSHYKLLLYRLRPSCPALACGA